MAGTIPVGKGPVHSGGRTVGEYDRTILALPRTDHSHPIGAAPGRSHIVERSHAIELLGRAALQIVQPTIGPGLAASGGVLGGNCSYGVKARSEPTPSVFACFTGEGTRSRGSSLGTPDGQAAAPGRRTRQSFRNRQAGSRPFSNLTRRQCRARSRLKPGSQRGCGLYPRT